MQVVQGAQFERHQTTGLKNLLLISAPRLRAISNSFSQFSYARLGKGSSLEERGSLSGN